MANWLDFNKKPDNKDDKVTEITPESINKSLTDTKTELDKKLSDLGESINNHPTLLAMKEFLDSQKTAADDAAARAEAARQSNDGKKFDDMDQTTREYVDKTLRPIAQATLYQQGTEMRRNIFENEDEFPYYAGSIRAQVDEMLDKQPAEQRANPEIIRNVYKIVVYNNDKEIKDNKIKSRLSSSSSSGTGTGMSSDADKAAMPVLTDQMKKVARDMGMTDADYAKSMKELQEAGEYA